MLFCGNAWPAYAFLQSKESKEIYRMNEKTKTMFVLAESWIKAYAFSKEAVLMGLSDWRSLECDYVNDEEHTKKGRVK